MADSNLPPIDELKQLLEGLRNYSRQGPTSFNRVKREVEGIVRKMSQMADIPKEQLKDLGELISRYEQIEDAVNDINTANRGTNRTITDLIRKLNSYAQQSAAVAEGLERSEGVYAKILKLLEEQTDEVKEQQTIEEKVEKTKKGNFEKLIKTKGILEDTNRILNIQISEQDRILDAIAISEGSYSELLGYLEGMGDSASKLLDTITSQSDVYDDNVDAVKQLVDNTKLSLMLQKQQYYIHLKYNDILEDSKKDVRDMYTKYAMISSLIPVIGQRLSKAFIRANAIAEEALDTAYNTFLETGNIFEAANQGLNVLTRGLGGIGTAFTAFALIMVGVYKLFKGIDQKVGEIAERTGLSADQSYILYKNSLQTQTAYANQYSSLEDILSIQSQLVSETGKQLNYTESLIGKVSDMSVVFGYSADTAGKLHNTFLQLAGSMPMKDAEELSTQMQYMLGSMAEANGIAPGIVAKDLVDNSEFVARNFAGMPERAMRAAVEVRKLGYSLAQAAKVSEHLFDIQGSLTSQMEASVALGRLVDMNAARRFALEGKTGKMMEELSKQVGSYAEFTEMTVPQRILLAKAAGMEVSELQRSLYIQKELGHLSTEEREKIANNLKDIEGITDMNAEQLKIASKQVNKTKEFDIAIQKIKMALVESILPIAETLVPLFSTLAKIINLLLFPLKIIKYIFESISFVVKKIVSGIKGLGDGAVVKTFEKVQNALVGADKSLSNMSENSSDTSKWFTGIVGSLALMTKTGRGLMGKMVTGPFKMAGKLMKMPFSKGVSTAATTASTTATTASTGPAVRVAGFAPHLRGSLQTPPSTPSSASFLSKLKTGLQSISTKAGSIFSKVTSSSLLPKLKTGFESMTKKGADIFNKFTSSGISSTVQKSGSLFLKAAKIAPWIEILGGSIRDMIKGTGQYTGGFLSSIETFSNELAANIFDFGNSVTAIFNPANIFKAVKEGSFEPFKKGLFDSFRPIQDMTYAEYEKLAQAYRVKTGMRVDQTKEGGIQKLIEWSKQNSEYLKTEGGLPNTMRSFESSSEVRESIQTIKKETEMQNKSTDMTMLNNNIRELINLNRMSVAQDKKMYIQFDNGTVREVSKIQRQTSA